MSVGTLPAFVDSLGSLLVSRLAVGAGEAAMMAATVLWLLRLAGPERRGRAMGHVGLANYAGSDSRPVAGPGDVRSGTPGAGVDHAAILPLGAAGCVVGLGSRWDRGVVLRRGGRRARARLGRAAEHAARDASPRPRADAGGFGYVAVRSFGAAAATEQGTGIAVAGDPGVGVGVIASRTILAGIPDRFGVLWTLSVGVVIEAAGLAGTAVTTSMLFALFAFVVMAIGQGLAVPSLGMLALVSVPASRHGRTAGAFFAYFDAGVGLGGPIVGVAARAPTRPEGSSPRPAPCSTAPVALVTWSRARTRPLQTVT